MKDYRIKNVLKALSPISHIGESISTTSYLVQDPVIQEDGSIKEVFCYSGNAFRGQLRDILATHYAETLNVKLSTDTFHLLYTGGKISGGQSINIEEAKEYRTLFPAFSLLGGGIGNQIIAGKTKVGNSYPICQEAKPILGAEYHEKADKISYRALTQEKSFSRMDDAKKQDCMDVMSEEMLAEVLKGKISDEVSTQMRMTSELLVAGAELVNEIYLTKVTQEELGAMLLAITEFAKAPYIGGQSNKGHGHVSIQSTLIDRNGGEIEIFNQDGTVNEKAQRRIDKYLEALEGIKTTFQSDDKLAKKMGVVCS